MNMSEENNKNKYVTEEYLDKRLAENNQILLGAIDSILEKRFTEMKEDLSVDISNTQTMIDGYVKKQEDFKQEFVVLKEETNQIKKVLKDKLGVEIGAIA